MRICLAVLFAALLTGLASAAALDALARRGDPALLKDIEPSMADEKALVRYTAAAAVIRLSGAPMNATPPAEK